MRLFLLPLILITFGRPDVEKAVTNYLNDRYPLPSAEYVCDFSRMNISRLDRFDSVAVDGFGKEIPRGNVVVRLSFFNKGSRAYQTAATLKIGVLKEVLISKIAIKAGEIITADMVAVELRDIAAVDGGVFDSIGQIGNSAAARYIAPGRIITGSMLTRPAAISAGDMVQIHFQKGSLSLTTKGIARQSGAIGSEIKVINTDTNRLISATVIDSATVSVTPKEEM